MEKPHRYAVGWDHWAWATRPLPGDIDGSYFNTPPDQQMDELRSDARIELENLNPDHARMVTHLVQVTPRATVVRGQVEEQVRLRCDTLWMNTHRGIAALTWRGQVLPAHPAQAGRVVLSAVVAAMPPEPASLPRAPVEAPSVASSPPPQPEQESVAEPVDLTIEQVVAIAAEIAEERATRAEVLHAHGLGERTWAEVERRWADAIEEDAARGSGKLRAASDTAYVSAVEGFRGPITLEEYADLVVGLERRRADRVLDELKIQRPALMRIVRLWTKKVSKDMKLADAAAQALRAVRRK